MSYYCSDMERYNSPVLDEDYKPKIKKKKQDQRQKGIDVCEDGEEDSSEEGSEAVLFSLDNVMNESEISDDEEDSYDSDLYIDEEDREVLARLPESRREEVLFERSERRKQIRERNALKNKLRVQLQKKRRGIADVGGQALTRHARDVERSGDKRQQDTLNELKVLREKKFKSNLSRGSTRQGSMLGEGEAEGEVRVGCEGVGGWNRQDTKKDVAEKEVIETEFMVQDETTYQDICRITICRNTLLKWIGEPYWDRTIRGVLVRACVGQNAYGGIYRLAEVVDYHEQENLKYVLDGKEYSMKLSLTIGDATRDFTLEYISNYLPSETEYQDWKRLVLSQKLLLPTKESIKRIYANVEAAHNYVHTSEDVDRKVAENNAKLEREGRNLAVYSPILRKNTLMMLKCARARQDHANIARLEAELRELDELKAAEQKRSVIATANAQIIFSINQKNRGKNTAIERSYVPESTILETELNPFARRPTYSSVFVAKQPKSLIETKETVTNVNKPEVLPEAMSPPHQLLEEDWKSSVDVDLKLDLDGQQLALVNTLIPSSSFSEEELGDSIPTAVKQSDKAAEEFLRTETQIPAPKSLPGRVVSLTDYLRQKRQN